jgi:hypothetical protein
MESSYLESGYIKTRNFFFTILMTFSDAFCVDRKPLQLKIELALPQVYCPTTILPTQRPSGYYTYSVLWRVRLKSGLVYQLH